MSCTDEPLNPGTRRAANIRPYGEVLPIQLTLNKEPRAVSPLQSGLRPASFPQGKLLVGAVSCSYSMYCYRNRQVAGRQIAAPYELRNFW